MADVAEQERDEALREIFGRGIVNMSFVSLTENPQMVVEISLLPGVAITKGWNSPHLADSGFDPSRQSDDFALVWGTSPGKGVLRHLGKERVGDHGAAVLISCADRVSAETHSFFRHLTVRLQRSLLKPLLPDVEAALMREIPANNEALKLLTAYIVTLDQTEAAPGPELAHNISQHIADLVALAIGTSGDVSHVARCRGLAAARLATIKRWTLARLGDPDLNISLVAASSGVSPRYVQRLFEAEGTTFRAFVLSYRLKLAHRRLANPGLIGRTISDIVFACGFGDLSYFDRCFRAVYGERPSDVRHRAEQRDG